MDKFPVEYKGVVIGEGVQSRREPGVVHLQIFDDNPVGVIFNENRVSGFSICDEDVKFATEKPNEH